MQKEKKEGKKDKDKDEKEEEAGKEWGGPRADEPEGLGIPTSPSLVLPPPGPPCGPICSNEQVEKLMGAVKPEIQTLKEKLNTVGGS